MASPSTDPPVKAWKHGVVGFIGWLVALTFIYATHGLTAATLELAINQLAGGQSLQLGSLRYETSARESFSFTRVSYLLSEFGFQRADGSWCELSNSVAWFDAEQGRTATRLELPDGLYRGLHFSVGLPPNLNHADLAAFGPEHPLNPNLNGLHWSWQGGYVFLALEGHGRNQGGFDGWSYHLARDTNRVG